MKNYLLALIFIITVINLKAQHPEKILIFLLTDFETNYPDHGLGGWLTDSINPWVIDESNPENIWQIGKPYKTAFDTANTVPNAIITDTLNPYPVNNHSSFQFLITKPEWAKDRCISHMQLFFINKFNTDTLCDGGYVEISYDNRKTWNNIINDKYSDNQFFQNFYTRYDTINGGISAFSGSTNNRWNDSGVILFWNDDKASLLDSISIRFNFKSDNINNNKDGWIIDNIYFLIEDYCTIGIDDIEYISNLLVYPNPVQDISILELPKNGVKYNVQIFSLNGTEVFNCNSIENIEINRSEYNPGIYIYKIINSQNQTYTGKFIIN